MLQNYNHIKINNTYIASDSHEQAIVTDVGMTQQIYAPSRMSNSYEKIKIGRYTVVIPSINQNNKQIIFDKLNIIMK